MSAEDTRRWSDESLALAAADGCSASFAELARRHDGFLAYIARPLYAPGLAADDFYQEALIALHDAAVSWNGRGSFTGFASMVVRRRLWTVVKTALRDKRGSKDAPRPLHEPYGPDGDDGLVLEERLADPCADPHRMVVARENLREISHRLPALTDLQRRAVIVAAVGASPSEAGDSKTIDNAYQRARSKLADLREAA